MDLTDSAYSPPRGSYTVELDLTVDQISCWRSFFDLKKLGVRRMGPSSFQWCPVTGQGAMGTNWGTGSSVWTWGGTSSLWVWRSTGTGCAGRVWSLLLWRYSRPTWTRSCAAYCRWPCLGRGVGLDDPQRSLPTPTILWFCDSVISEIWISLLKLRLICFPKLSQYLTTF